MEDLVNMRPECWKARSVFVTGHTGFKGSWLSIWLSHLGAKIHGYALCPQTNPSLFDVAQVARLLATDTRADLADVDTLRSALKQAQPEVVFHLAAQPLVRESYRDPIRTIATNVMGTAQLLDVIRSVESVQAVLVITTDKVYENREWYYPYREVDPLGGHDPYSASKAAAEIVAATFRASFFGSNSGHPARIATARAGNVIGGGDWSAERLVPDCLHAFSQYQPVRLRFPQAVRPWQHVLDALAGYLKLAEQLLASENNEFARAWNFGPGPSGDATVGRVADILKQLWGEDARVEQMSSGENPHEAGLLRLDSTCANTILGWKTRWSLEETLAQTVAWHQAWLRGADMAAVSLDQIRAYELEDQP